MAIAMIGLLRSWDTVFDEVVLHLLQVLEQRDVAQDGGEADRLAVLGGDEHEARLGGTPVGERELHHARLSDLEETAQRLVLDRLDEGPAGHGLRRHPQHRACGRVGEEHEPVLPDHHHRVGGAGQDRGQGPALVGQRLVRTAGLERARDSGGKQGGDLEVVERVGRGPPREQQRTQICIPRRRGTARAAWRPARTSTPSRSGAPSAMRPSSPTR
jgi:hypothetical protein